MLIAAILPLFFYPGILQAGINSEYEEQPA